MPTLKTPAGLLAYFDSAPGAAGQPDGKPIVMLLHSSAGASLQWRKLIGAVATRYRVIAPDLIGYGATPMITAAPVMADEVAHIAALAKILPAPFHLVGHSYGGAVALEAARTIGSRVASLALYEPVAFHLLRWHGKDAAWAEIAAVAKRHIELTGAGNNQAAAEAFIGYWTGPGTFAAMPAELKGYVVSTMPKIAAEWRMVLDNPDGVEAYRWFDFPMLVLSGQRTTLAARTVAEILRGTLPGASWLSLPGIGHMGPVTHPGPVNAALIAFLDDAVQRKRGGPVAEDAAPMAPPLVPPPAAPKTAQAARRQ